MGGEGQAWITQHPDAKSCKDITQSGREDKITNEEKKKNKKLKETLK